MVTHNKAEIHEINYNKIVEKAQNIMNSWHSRNLSLFGKILVINTLVVSLFVYKMTVLPSIPNQIVKKLEDQIQKFIWNNRKPKIALKILKANRDDGGAGLADIKLKDRALKTSWLKILQTDSMLAECANKNLGGIQEDIWRVNIAPKDVIKMFRPSFWRDVLYDWSHLNYEENISNQNVLNQIIWYNSHWKIDNKLFIVKEAYQSKLKTVGQLIEVNGDILKIEDICTRYKITVMQANSILAAMPKEWKPLLKSACEKQKESQRKYNYDEFIQKEHEVSKYYKKQNATNSIFKEAFKKWQKSDESLDCTFDEYCESFSDLYVITNNTKLRSFQYRILHKAIVLNSHLFR